MVFDPLVSETLFGHNSTDVNLYETEAHRLKSRLFRVSTVRITSFRESISSNDEDE